MKDDIPDLIPGHCIDGFVPVISFLELDEKNTKIPEYTHYVENDDDISISTYQIYQKIPNGIKFSICKMFAIDENVSFHKMFELMGPVCIVSIEIINRFLRDCFHLVDKEKLFEKKITFQSSNEVIGREYFNVIYCGTSYIHIKDDNSCDILHSDLINVASRSKNLF